MLQLSLETDWTGMNFWMMFQRKTYEKHWQGGGCSLFLVQLLETNKKLKNSSLGGHIWSSVYSLVCHSLGRSFKNWVIFNHDNTVHEAFVYVFSFDYCSNLV